MKTMRIKHYLVVILFWLFITAPTVLGIYYYSPAEKKQLKTKHFSSKVGKRFVIGTDTVVVVGYMADKQIYCLKSCDESCWINCDVVLDFDEVR